MLNRVELIGNLGRDPEIRHTQDGRAIANLSLATTERWRDKQTGERREKTEWHRVVIFGNLADIAQKYLVKGSKVYLSGKLKTRKWTDNSGVEKYTTEVVLENFGGQLIMLDSRGDREDGGGSSSGPSASEYAQASGGTTSAARAQPGQTGGYEADPGLDDEIPF